MTCEREAQPNGKQYYCLDDNNNNNTEKKERRKQKLNEMIRRREVETENVFNAFHFTGSHHKH